MANQSAFDDKSEPERSLFNVYDKNDKDHFSDRVTLV
jgi:hypothetical protein